MQNIFPWLLIICAFLSSKCLSKLLGGVESSILCSHLSCTYDLLSRIVQFIALSYLLWLSSINQFPRALTLALFLLRSSSLCDRIGRGLAFAATDQIPILCLTYQVVLPQIFDEEKVRPGRPDPRALSKVRRYEHHAYSPAFHWYGTRKLTIVPLTKWTFIQAWWADIAEMSEAVIKPFRLIPEGVVTI